MGIRYGNKHEETKSERDDRLQAEWEAMMPCHRCHLTPVCKYQNTIKRVDIPPVFEIKIYCNICGKYIETKQVIKEERIHE